LSSDGFIEANLTALSNILSEWNYYHSDDLNMGRENQNLHGKIPITQQYSLMCFVCSCYCGPDIPGGNCEI